jgi:5-methylcytosine-specific restriction protein A
MFLTPDPEAQKRERNKAREIRASAWWKGQVGRGTCHYCKKSVPPNQLTMDHKTPVMRGGKSNKHNLVPACKSCNNEKQNKTLGEWLQEREAAGNPLPISNQELY